MKLKNSPFSLFSVLLLVSASGCLDSPILHHSDAQVDPKPLRETPETGCPYPFKKYGLCAAIEWTQMPTDETKGSFTIRFWNAKKGSASNGPFVDPGHEVFVKLWMPEMGHGSSPVTIMGAKDESGETMPGVYAASDVYFVMGGVWEIWLQLRNGKTVLDQAKTDISIE